MDKQIALISDFTDTNILSVSLEDVDLVLCRDEKGEVYALEDKCSHADVELSGGEISNGCIVCPAHGGAFDIKTGKATCMPAVAPVKSFEISVKNGIIYLSNAD